MMNLLGVRFDYVNEVVGHAKLWESDILHCLVYFDPVSLASGPFLLDFSMRFPSHFFPILDRFPYVIKTVFIQRPNVVFFFISSLLDCTNVFDSLYSLLHFLVPPLHIHIFTRRKCHEVVFLELIYSYSE
jgi:hypothetical protein